MTISRRTVIKGLGASIATTSALAVSSGIAGASAGVDASRSEDLPDSLNVQLAHQWGDDSLAAVIRNTSGHTVTLLDINSVAADYGRFNFSELTRNGPITLAPGAEIHVPFVQMGTPVKPYGHFDNRLQKLLKASMTVSTTNPVASVSTSMSPRIV